MLYLAIALYFLAAVLGSILLVAILQGRQVPEGVKNLHGPIALLVLMLVLVYTLIHGASPYLLISLILFIIAAAIGVTMFLMGKYDKPIPKAMVLIHPVVAFVGLIFLIVYCLP